MEATKESGNPLLKPRTFSWEPEYVAAVWSPHDITLSPQQRGIVSALVKASPCTLFLPDLAHLMTDKTNPRVVISQIRKVLKQISYCGVITIVNGGGYAIYSPDHVRELRAILEAA